MHGIRHFLRDFTATAVKEHLRSQLDSGEPKLTRKEAELLRFMADRTTDWQLLVPDRSSGRTS
jgi:hypothetical protein